METKHILVLAATLFYSINICLSKVHWSDEMLGIREECMKENSLTQEEIRNAFKSGERPENVLCFKKCIMLKQGLIDENGAIQKDSVADILSNFFYLNEEEREKVVECVKGLEVTVEKCEDSLQVMECYPKKEKHND